MSGVSDVSTDETFSNFSASAALAPSMGTASSSHAFTKILVKTRQRKKTQDDTTHSNALTLMVSMALL